MHERTRFRLHSHDVPYGSGSGQQSVTAFPNVDDSNSYWVCWWFVVLNWTLENYWQKILNMGSFQIVRPLLGSSSKQGDSIKSGTIIRLQHMRTRKWLHSHLHASPISGNLEVSQDFALFVPCFLKINAMYFKFKHPLFWCIHFIFISKQNDHQYPIAIATLTETAFPRNSIIKK